MNSTEISWGIRSVSMRSGRFQEGLMGLQMRVSEVPLNPPETSRNALTHPETLFQSVIQKISEGF